MDHDNRSAQTTRWVRLGTDSPTGCRVRRAVYQQPSASGEPHGALFGPGRLLGHMGQMIKPNWDHTACAAAARARHGPMVGRLRAFFADRADGEFCFSVWGPTQVLFRIIAH